MTDNQESKELEQKGGDLSDKLLDCPFCGRLGGIITWTDNFAGGCKCGCQLIPKKSLSEAIESWNTRASSEQLTTTQQALDSAVEALKFYTDCSHLSCANKELKFMEGMPTNFFPSGFGGKEIQIKDQQPFGTRAKAALASIKE